jgi:hypothetical protein
MSFTEFALRMFPYWSLGGLMFWAIWKSDFKDLLRFDLKAFSKFFLYMLTISLIRYFMIKWIVGMGMGSNFQAVKGIPIGAVFFTPWEDLCHSVPLVLLRRMIGTSKWTWPIHTVMLITVTTSFGLGHIYQGYWAAAMISLYIPFAVGFIQKRGASTIMASHVLYDFCTLMVVRLVIG